MTGEENLRLIREIEANRAFLLAIYQQNPALLARAEPRIRELLQPLPYQPPAATSAEWLAVAKRRLEDIGSVRVQAIPGEEVFEKVHRHLGR
jgi:hypothetical protein